MDSDVIVKDPDSWTEINFLNVPQNKKVENRTKSQKGISIKR